MSEPMDDVTWPPPIAKWLEEGGHRSGRLAPLAHPDEGVLVYMGKLLAEHPENDLVKRKALAAAQDYVSAASDARSDLDSRKDNVAKAYGISAEPGSTLLRAVDAYLGGHRA